jgi:hypothetical protein
MTCQACGAPILPHEDRCHVCGADVGFPNIRAAELPTEQAALASRVSSAQVSATARGILPVLEDFVHAVATMSRAVLARSLGQLDAFIKSENLLYVSFHNQVRAGSRIPEDDHWDRGRTAAESTVHPIYHEKINYAALSLDGFGVQWWGKYSILLKEVHIARRTSVFEENPFLFCERHRIIAGRPTPPGYRASWNHRGKLAMAKLVEKLSRTTRPEDYPAILLSQGTSKGNADFIECHIYGPTVARSSEC